VTADLDADGHVIGIEVLDVGESLGRVPRTTVILEQLPRTIQETIPAKGPG
jgi:hypothetical protein